MNLANPLNRLRFLWPDLPATWQSVDFIHYQQVRLSIARVVYCALAFISLLFAISNFLIGKPVLAVSLLGFAGFLGFLFWLSLNNRLAAIIRFNLVFAAGSIAVCTFAAATNGSLPVHVLPCFSIFFYCLLSVRQAFVGSVLCVLTVSVMAYQVDPEFFSSLEAQRVYISIGVVWLCSHIAHCFFFKMSMTQQELLKSQSNFLRTVNHELRTPLASLMSATHLLKQREIPVDLRDEVDQINAIAQQMTTLISGVLDLSRAENHLAIQSSRVDLRGLLDHVASLYKAMADNKGLKLSLHVTDHVPEAVETDKVRLVQVLSNLLSNAIKYSDNGTVCLNLSASVDESSSASLRFSVIDEGQGLSAAQQAKLFQPYTRFHNQHEDHSSGLGLTIVKELVALLDGRVGVESELGKGSVFWFEIEAKILHDSLPDTSSDQDNKRIAQLVGSHLLVVDDDRMLLRLICKLLTVRGANCTAVQSAKEALNLVKNSKYDLILTDYHMPDLNGGDLTSMIRSMPEYKTTPILALSGGILEGDLDYAKQSGIDEILSKPINPDLLYSKVSSYLGLAN